MDFPVDHLSASSVTTFLRCPLQWQDKYVLGNEGQSNSALVMGTLVHAMLAEALKGNAYDSHLMLEMAIAEDGGRENIEWKKDEEYVHNVGLKMVYDYYEQVGKFLEVEDTEVEIEIDVPGVPIPVVGFIDFLASDRNVDLKTTGWYRSPPNPEWKVQHRIYQLHRNLPGENHVITPKAVVVPASTSDKLYVPPSDPAKTERLIRQVYQQIKWAWEEWGSEDPWPAGGITHPWAGKYCSVANCCQND